MLIQTLTCQDYKISCHFLTDSNAVSPSVFLHFKIIIIIINQFLFLTTSIFQ